MPSNKRWGTNTLANLRQRLAQVYGPYCWLCGVEIPIDKISPDHVVPVRNGGTNDISNLRPSHLSCNKRRGARAITELRKPTRPSRAW